MYAAHLWKALLKIMEQTKREADFVLLLQNGAANIIFDIIANLPDILARP